MQIIEIQDENEKVAKSIRGTFERHGLGNFTKSWKKNSKELEEWTPCDFLRGIEDTLMIEPSEQVKTIRSQAGRDVPAISWAGFMQITKTTNLSQSGKTTQEMQQRTAKIDEALVEYIKQRAHEFAADLMERRDFIVEKWKDELLDLNSRAGKKAL